jgi:hypothetical protein
VEDGGRAWLERRGIDVVDTQERVVLELDAALDAVSQGSGGVAITDFASRPDLAPELVRLHAEGMEDVPGDLAREEPPALEAWQRWQEPPSRRPEFLVIALDGDDAVGWAQLNVYPRVPYHAFTVVARSHRGRGIATAQDGADPPRARPRPRAPDHELERRQRRDADAERGARLPPRARAGLPAAGSVAVAQRVRLNARWCSKQ